MKCKTNDLTECLGYSWCWLCWPCGYEIKVFSVDEPPGVYYLLKYDLTDLYLNAFVLYTGQFRRAVKKTTLPRCSWCSVD